MKSWGVEGTLYWRFWKMDITITQLILNSNEATWDRGSVTYANNKKEIRMFILDKQRC